MIPPIPPTSTEQVLKIERLPNCTFSQMEKAVDRQLMMLFREQFFEHHDFVWDIASSIASVATGQWLWVENTAWRYWEPPHKHLGAYKAG